MKLSVVVVVYNMQRETPRTLLSLSPSYQRDIAEKDYEVIVVENGSTQPLLATAAKSLGENFHYHFLNPAPSSPARALNFGMRQARGDVIGVMIDGARICTPGLLHHVLGATRLYERAIVATPGFYLGSGFQRFAIAQGHTAEYEDSLLARIGWPEDGYRLFDIGSLDESSHFLPPIAESNALFLRRELWEELHGIDERFDMPGGGLVNLDTLVRACELPESELVILLGEATFHQVHGGIATNSALEVFEPRLAEWRAQYEKLRGKSFESPIRPRRYFGSMPMPCWQHLATELFEAFGHLKEREAMQKELAAAREEVSRLRSEVTAIAKEREELRAEMGIMRGSHSWTLTRPLRSAYRGVSTLKNIAKLGKSGRGA